MIENLKVLYVEDDKAVRENTYLLLKEIFKEVILASDGLEAIEVFSKEKVDILITDINMPRLNGIELIKKIRQENKDIPIIVISAHSDVDYIIQAINYSVDGYVLKPINLDVFLNVVNKVVDKIKLQRENQRLLALLKQYQKAIDEFLIVSKTDPSGRITYVNPKFEKISGYKKEELLGENHRVVRHPDMPKEFFDQMWSTIKKGKKWSGIVKNKAKSGNPYYVDTIILPITDENGKIVEFFSIRQDITSLINPQKKLQLSLNPEKFTFVAIVRIQNFSYLEDLYDFESISSVEAKIKEVINTVLPKDCNIKDIINLGGGEFVLIREFDETPSERMIEHIIKKVQNLPQAIQKEAYKIIDYDLVINISVAYGKDAYKMAKYGIRKIEETGEDFILVNDVQEKIKEEAKKNLLVLKKVKTALDEDRITVFFQPIINNNTLEVEKYEALVRIIDEDGNVVSPFFFLDIVKNTKYYREITKQVIFKSIKAQKILKKGININLSYTDIAKEEIRQFIFKALETIRSCVSCLTFEIVETEEVKNDEVVYSFIKQIKSYGVNLAIDDFGTGYSNLEKIIKYRPDFIKIDGSLIRRIKEERTAFELVEGIVNFCKEENFKTVAEFVEDEEFFGIVKELGIDYSQGYFFGKPEPLENLT